MLHTAHGTLSTKALADILLLLLFIATMNDTATAAAAASIVAVVLVVVLVSIHGGIAIEATVCLLFSFMFCPQPMTDDGR